MSFYKDSCDRWVAYRIAASEGKDFVQFLPDCSFQYAVTYAMDEGDLSSSMADILADDPPEGIHLEL